MAKAKAKSVYADRGKWLEDALSYSGKIAMSRSEGALVKMATPYAMPIGSDGERKLVRKVSTVDFIGHVCGIPVACDAKATKGRSLPLKNVHDHQVNFLLGWEDAGGLGALIVGFESDGAWLVSPSWFAGTRDNIDRKSIPVDMVREASIDPRDVVPVERGGRSYPLDWCRAFKLYAVAKDFGRELE